MAHITGRDRSQTLLLPETLDDYVGKDNPVRFIDAFVNGLDFAPAGFAPRGARCSLLWLLRELRETGATGSDGHISVVPRDELQLRQKFPRAAVNLRSSYLPASVSAAIDGPIRRILTRERIERGHGDFRFAEAFYRLLQETELIRQLIKRLLQLQKRSGPNNEWSDLPVAACYD